MIKGTRDILTGLRQYLTVRKIKWGVCEAMAEKKKEAKKNNVCRKKKVITYTLGHAPKKLVS